MNKKVDMDKPILRNLRVCELCPKFNRNSIMKWTVRCDTNQHINEKDFARRELPKKCPMVLEQMVMEKGYNAQ